MSARGVPLLAPVEQARYARIMDTGYGRWPTDLQRYVARSLPREDRGDPAPVGSPRARVA